MAPRRWAIFTHILVPLDGSEFSEQALGSARSLAEKYAARITLLTVMVQVPESRLQVPMLDQRSEERGRQYLEDMRATHTGAAAMPMDLVVRHGMPAETITEVAPDSHADLIVMSTHGTTGTRCTLGSTAWKIFQDAPCHVLLIAVHRPMAAE